MENREQDIIDAYIRGASWSVENKGDHKLLVKAACDYADKTMGDPSEHFTTDTSKKPDFVNTITDEMAEAAEVELATNVLAGYHYIMTIDGMKQVITSALAAAPKAEPVGYVTPDAIKNLQYGGLIENIHPAGTLRPENEIPLFAAPPAPSDEKLREALEKIDIHEVVDRLLDAQQDINLAANERMDQSLCDASALIDEVEKILHIVAALKGDA